jgi:hypothetical protein
LFIRRAEDTVLRKLLVRERLMAMHEGEPELSLGLLNRATVA